jgi:hypothetical protein
MRRDDAIDPGAAPQGGDDFAGAAVAHRAAQLAAGEYLVDEQLPDGSVVIRPDTSAAAMRRRLGLEQISAEEFEAFIAKHGDEMLPPDDEG